MQTRSMPTCSRSLSRTQRKGQHKVNPGRFVCPKLTFRHLSRSSRLIVLLRVVHELSQKSRTLGRQANAFVDFMADGEGFEPPVPFQVQQFSRLPVSTAHTSLRQRFYQPASD